MGRRWQRAGAAEVRGWTERRCSKQKLTRHRMFTKDGELVATCVQEVRDKQKAAKHWRAREKLTGACRAWSD